ncbi:hypothetical protein [Bryobacter aggregatus]|uniref:hypothetical protein n=1 Tax=Bryobacter aggregatus TaxID=360054 RepID=UPI000B1B4568|nr:hypothetical protein [Bryobacter aggregatus]
MITEAQVEARRANGRKSRGPRTTEGKFRSSLNALRHGAYSHNYVIRTEDAEVFRNFANDIIAEIEPKSAIELELVDHLLLNAWRRRRLTTLLNQRANRTIEEVAAESTESISDLNLRAFEKLETEWPSYTHQQQLEFRFASAFQRTLLRLQSLRRNEAQMAYKQQKRRNEPTEH